MYLLDEFYGVVSVIWGGGGGEVIVLVIRVRVHLCKLLIKGNLHSDNKLTVKCWK